MMKLNNDNMITVCSECLMACCWNGDFMCEESQNANTVEKTIAELKKLNYEHPSNWEKQYSGGFDDFICLKCKTKYNKSKLSIENYGEDFALERYCCPKCDGTCIELEDY